MIELLLGLALAGQVRTATVAIPPDARVVASPVVRASGRLAMADMTVGDVLGLQCGAGICPALPITVTAVSLDGHWHAFKMGLGLGIDYKFPSEARFPIAVGLAVAPLLEIDGQAQDASFAAMVHADVFKGFGLALVWDAFAIGGEEAGFHPLHARRLALAVSFDPLNDIWL